MDNNPSNKKYDIGLNEITFLRKPLERVLDKIKVYNFITPNLLTSLSFAFAVIAAMIILLPSRISLVFSGIFIIFSYLLDCMDGRLARLKNMESHFGFWFDRLTDQFKLSLLILALGIRAYNFEEPDEYILIAAAAVIIIQLIKEFNWSLFEIFCLKISSKKNYDEVILDNIGVTFTKDNLFQKIIFHAARALAFLHYEQIAVLGIFPVILGAEKTIYIYGLLSAISLAGRLAVYSRIFRKIDAK